MAEPKKLLETALYNLLSGDGIGYDIYNTKAVGTSFGYVVFQSAGGDDEGYHEKKRGRSYDYQVVGVTADRSSALDMLVAIDLVMAGAKAGLSVSGHAVVDVARAEPIDYTQVTPDGVYVYHVGGIWTIELEET